MREIVLSEQDIQKICIHIAKELDKDFGNDKQTPIVIGVMKGALNFMLDLTKYIKTPIITDFIQISSYEGTRSTGNIHLKKDVTENIKDRTIVIVEDIIDTGLSMSYLVKHFKKFEPKQIKIVTLLDKIYMRKKDIKIDYIGKVLEEPKFVVGYGLDYNEIGRNIPYVFIPTAKDLELWDSIKK